MEKTKIIKTKYGKVQGYIEKSINVFKGIPYAAPPIGDFRFKPPKPPKQMEGVFEALEFSSICPQVPVLPSAKWLFGSPLEESEANSLTLNIWTPETDEKCRPVMFWIHGGNFNNGSSAQLAYDGLPLSLRGDVVVVTINYRLGPLGYLFIPGITANVGQLDQIAALEWVKDNIKTFGGDPNNVTIFGESAGGTAVITLLAMPAAKNLFHRVIAQSTASYLSSLHEEGSDDISSMLKVEPRNLEALQGVKVEKIKKAHRNYITKTFLEGRSNPFSPVVDGKILPKKPLKTIRAGFAKDIPLLIGTNRDEMRFMRPILPDMPEIDSNGLIKRITQTLTIYGYDSKLAEELINTYKKERAGILPNTPQDISEAFLTDLTFRILSIRLAEAQYTHQPNTYMYLFTWPSPLMDGILGASHAVEVPFVFGTHNKPENIPYSGTGKDADILSENIMDAWIAFARTGNPNHENIPEWPSYSDKRETMILDKEIKVESAPFEAERKVWDRFEYI